MSEKFDRFCRTLSFLRKEQIFWRIWGRLRHPWHRTPLYSALCLTPRPIPEIKRLPDPLWSGDASNGERILNGRIRLLEREAEFAEKPNWRPKGQSHLWLFTLHYFEWLADLAALGTPAASARARQLIDHWLVKHPRPDGLGWHPYPLSLRLFTWLAHKPFILSGSDPAFRHRLLSACDCQARYLAEVLEFDVGGNHLIKNLKTMIAVAVAFPEHEFRLPSLLEQLKAEIATQILPDGCHYERSPDYHLQVLCDFVDIFDLLPNPPDWLAKTVDKMSGAYMFFRHGDGGLALFNDGTVGKTRRMVALDARLSPLPAPPQALGHAGYFRFTDGEARLIFDAGACCPDDLPAHAHADTLSFEFSDGSHRLIVNCGTYAYQDPEWRNLLRGTAAHSTVTVDDEDSAEVYDVFRLGRRPRRVSAAKAGEAIIASHDGYAETMGVVHHRRIERQPGIFLGEDWIEGTGVAGRTITARFHLHPDVVVEAGGGGALCLKAGESCRWLFNYDGGTLSIGPSIYSPRFHVMKQTRLMMLETVAEAGGARLSWSFSRI
jgi:uncharacterized heparinase superfamily protein